MYAAFFTLFLALSPQQAPASYAREVLPILQQKCLACHSGVAKMGGLVMESYESLMQGGAHGPVIVPGKGSESRIILMLEGKLQPRMPFNGVPLSAREIETIRRWIDGGAKGPASNEVLPSAPEVRIPDIKPQVPVVSPIGSVKFSPDGQLLAVGSYQEVRLIDARTGKAVATLPDHADLVRSLAFDPSGKRLAAAGGRPLVAGEVKLWDVQTHELLRTVKGQTDCIYSVAFSPDGKVLATSSYDKLVKLWEVQSGKELKSLKDHIDAVFAVAFSPDGKWLATGSQDRTVKIWDANSGERLYTLGEPQDGIVTIAFSPDGRQIAAAGYDKLIYVWNLDPKGATLAASLIADEDTILQLVWSPDGKEIITSSVDASIRVRDAATLNSVRVLPDQSDWVEALSISGDGKRLAAGRYDGTLSVYDLTDYRQLLARSGTGKP
ncbi:MAG TPA: c-type cytochrome domain-containing protein [Candidatus Dormibacteraeota bacterium]|nr:c-type cytochrome domain-containing protein [Candidatus Dormibacteraeota bacterium]